MKTRDAVSGGFYLSVVGMYIYSLWYNIAFITKGADNLFSYDGYGGKFKYLTFWNHVRFECTHASMHAHAHTYTHT